MWPFLAPEGRSALQVAKQRRSRSLLMVLVNNFATKQVRNAGLTVTACLSFVELYSMVKEGFVKYAEKAKAIQEARFQLGREAVDEIAGLGREVLLPEGAYCSGSEGGQVGPCRPRGCRPRGATQVANIGLLLVSLAGWGSMHLCFFSCKTVCCTFGLQLNRLCLVLCSSMT